jgi:hypothetical protein
MPSGEGPAPAAVLEQIGLSEPLVAHPAGSAGEDRAPGHEVGEPWEREASVDPTILAGLVHP